MTVLNRQRSRPVDRSALQRFVSGLAHAMPPPGAASVAVCLVSDRRMREYNRRFRGCDRTTDVLSFADDGGDEPEGERHLGDILISVPQAERQAGGPRRVERELRVLLIHGYLHLLGYDHERDDGTMRRIERRLVRRLVDGGNGG